MTPPRERERRADGAGVSLVEGLLALALLSMVALTVAGMLGVATRQLAASRDLALLTVLGQQKMEQLRSDVPDVEETVGSLESDEAGYFDAPTRASLRRWRFVPLGDGEGRTLGIEVRVILTSQVAPASRDVVLRTEVF